MFKSDVRVYALPVIAVGRLIINMPEPIAIVGIGGVFPGARDLDEFWHNIINAKDAALEVGQDRWRLNPDELYSTEPAADKVNSRRACLIRDFKFDPSGFNVDAALLQRLDPMYQILLQAGRAAWNDANTEPLNKQRVGIIIGNIVLPTESSSLFSDELFKPLFEQQLFNEPQTGAAPEIESLNRYVAGLPAGLLAEALGFGAGACTLDAACAASLYSLKYAVDELSAGRCDALLAGGVARPDSLYTQMGFSQLNAISKTGRCSPFDSKADGLVVGEGAGIFVLKRLDDAVRQHDRIYATIEAIGLSNDIEGNIMVPDTEGQLRAMRSAYAAAGWLPEQVQHIECHGTGTPVGDAVEFSSLNNLWQAHQVKGQCVIGSVKSNVGHLLTAAGAAAVMKTLLAMQHGLLPPTANFEQPAAGINLADSPFKILQQAQRWEVKANQPRRAAISGFGFGGINAHLLLQEYRENNRSKPHRRPLPLSQPGFPEYGKNNRSKPVHTADHRADIAIVGMDTHLGRWRDRDSFDNAIIFGADSAATRPQHWWGAATGGQRAYCIDQVNLPVGRYRIPPAELNEMLPQQLLMLEVAANALEDAGCSELTQAQRTRTGVFIGIALDMNTANFHFRWMQKKYSRAWLSRSGIELNETERDEWIENLSAACGPALSANRTMGALGGIVASRIARTFRIGGPAFTVSAEETSGLRALAFGVRALQRHELDQVIVGAVDLASDLRAVRGHPANPDLVADGATALILKRYADADRAGDHVYTLINGLGFAAAVDERTAQAVALQTACADAQCDMDSIDLQAYSAAATVTATPALQPAVTTQFALGHSGAADGLFTVTSGIRFLNRRLLPADHTTPARYWLKDRSAGPRRCLVNGGGIDGNSVSVVLQEADVSVKTSLTGAKLFVVAAADKTALHNKIQALCFDDESLQRQDGVYRAAILVNDKAEFNTACAELLIALNNNSSINNGRSFYSVEPLAGHGKIAFVYPGSGNHFWGMGRELSVAFPGLLEKLNNENEKLASQFAGGCFWQRRADSELTHEQVILGQVWLGAFVSDVVSSFGIRPDAVIGYSLGETTGLFSTRTWTARDEMLKRIQQSSLFTEELAGPCASVQRAWGTDKPVAWALGVVDAAAEQVTTVLKHYRHVYLLIINTPDECVIGGDRDELNQAVKQLGAQYHPLSGITTVHCEVARPVRQAYRDLHIFPTTPPAGVTFYSGIRAGAYQVTQDSAADSILGQALAHFDYTKVINSAYEDGVRLFIEMGPGGSCSRMIARILEGKPHYAKSLCVKGQDSVDNVLQLLANLYAEGVSLDLTGLSAHKKEPGRQYKNYISVSTGGKPFKVPLPPSSQPGAVDRKPAPEKAHDTALQTGAQRPLKVVEAGARPLIEQARRTEQARAAAQETFLQVSQGLTASLARAVNLQLQLLHDADVGLEDAAPGLNKAEPRVAGQFDRDACLEFAIGAIGKVLGDRFADIDRHPTRVRLPDAPLMLVDRIIQVEGEPDSMSAGRVVTEHEVRPAAWYLDAGRIPTCIAVEAGQADLFLSAYLGIDHITKGLAVYRLLDARITFHAPLPVAGQTIRYDIHIDQFFRQGDTWLFRFNFKGGIVDRDGDGGAAHGNETPLLTMTHGCAGFFTRPELDAGRGIVLSNLEQRRQPGLLTGNWRPLVDMQTESYSDEQLNALRNGELVRCFGDSFADLDLNHPAGLPGGRMTLVQRILKLDPAGGRYGIGQITGEADIHPDDWFLTCHFVDDRVMPGTLMYECCLHTLRVYLLRMGWVGEVDEFVYEPVIGQTSQLKCRGQVIESTGAVQYEITLKEIGYQPDGTPYVLADALMYADHRAIVQMQNMSVQLTGLTREKLETRWADKRRTRLKPVLFDNASILAFADGNPSAAFGDRYKVFDRDRRIARLPRPPYKFLDRIISIEDCEQWVLDAGGVIEAEYEVPKDEWYFTDNNQAFMPFAVLLEIALQPCGWLAAYLGSALTSETDLSFRNLGGKAVQYINVAPGSGVLKTRVKITKVSQSGGMIIQNFDYAISLARRPVYQGDTYFGFFSGAALADQIGLREAKQYIPTDAERARGESFPCPTTAPMPTGMMRMLDAISLYVPDGGPYGLGFIEGKTNVDPEAWFFKAHFYQDPVWPGSLGLESFQQLLKVFAWHRWQAELSADDIRFEGMALKHEHQWLYRGQVLPTDNTVTVQAVITGVDDPGKTVTADGFLSVDGRIIYQMKDFALRIT